MPKHNASGIGNFIGVDDVLLLGAGFFGDHSEGITFLHDVTDALFGLIFREARINGGARCLIFGESVES